MKEVINVMPETIFKYLKEGTDVYSFDTNKEEITDLLYETVDEVLSHSKNDARVFFIIVESEE